MNRSVNLKAIDHLYYTTIEWKEEEELARHTFPRRSFVAVRARDASLSERNLDTGTAPQELKWMGEDLLATLVVYSSSQKWGWFASARARSSAPN
jgi:hypothetical protein